MKTVTSRHHTLVTRFRAAARAGRRTRTELLLDGARLVGDARRFGATIHTLLVAADALSRDAALRQLADACAADGAEVLAGADPVLAAASPLRSPSTAVALAAHGRATLAQVLARLDRGCVLAPVGVQDPGNVGAIVRTAHAAGAAGVVVAAESADPYGWKALRGAMGSTFGLPVAEADDIHDLVRAATAAGFVTVAATPRGGRSLYDVDFRRPRLVLIGGEGSGLDPAVAPGGEPGVSIPMADGVESLNVAVAAGLIAYEARRQRGAG